MAHVVTEPCINCKYTECVAVCPVQCFHEGVNFVVIDPEKCIDCGSCIEECPVDAIYPEDKVPAKWREYIRLNATYAKVWPLITERKAPHPAADEFRGVENKRHLLDPGPFNG